MINKINVEKSIETNKIHFCDPDFSDLAELVIFYIIALLTPIGAFIYEFQHRETFHANILGSIISVLLALLFSTIILYLLLTRKDLKRFPGIPKEVINEAIKELNWETEVDNKNYLIINPGTRDRQLSIIFDGREILIHTLRFTKVSLYFGETDKLNLFLSKVEEIKKGRIHRHRVR